MTSIVALGNRDQFIQIADRRLTYVIGGKTVTANDDFNKAIAFYPADARLAVGFSGLAEIRTFNTRAWLLDGLHKSALPDYIAENILRRFTDKATDDFNRLPILKAVSPKEKRLSIMFTGYLYSHEPPLPILAVISNHRNLDENSDTDEAKDHFDCFFRYAPISDTKNVVLSYEVGVGFKIDEADKQVLMRLVETRKPASAIMGKLVEAFEKFSDDPHSQNVVGKQLSGIVIPSNRALEVQGAYYSSVVKQETYMPDMVYAQKGLHMNVTNISVRPHDPTDTPPLSVPKVGRNEPCPCNSGRKYKHCHGRRTKGNVHLADWKAKAN